MIRRQVTLQWFVGEESWENSGFLRGKSPDVSFSSDGQADLLGEHRLMLRVLRSALILSFIFALTCGAAITRAEHQQLQTIAEIQALSDLELKALRTDDRELRDMLLDNRLALVEMQGWLSLHRVRRAQRYGIEAEIVDIDVQGNEAIVLAEINPPQSHWVPVSYLETRFYEKEDSTWLRTVPPADFWGERQRLETEHLHIEFYARDAETVHEIADELEAAYSQIYAMFDIQPAEYRYKLAFLVEPRVVGSWSSSGVRVEVASPSLYRLPADASSSEQLASAISTHLVSRALSDALNTTELYFLPRWYNVLIGIRDWVAANELDRPSYLHTASEDFWREQYQQYWPLSLTDLAEQGQIDPDHRLARYFVSQSIIAYAVEAYGVDSLPALVQALPRHDSWEPLIREVYGTSAVDFTAGWNEYLAEQYDQDAYREVP